MLTMATRVMLMATLLVCTGRAIAGNTWTGGSSSTSNWSDNANWGGAQPAYGTISFSGTTRTVNTDDENMSQNFIDWTGSSAWTLNNANSAVLSLYDNGGAQAKVQNDSSGLVTINSSITYAANNGSPPNPFGEFNAVSGDITCSSGTLTVNGSSCNGIKMWGGSGRTVTFNNTVSASGKWFGFTAAPAGSATIAGSFTSGDFYVMNGGTLNLGSGGSFSTTGLRLGGDYGNTGNQNQTLGGAFVLTSPTGGQTYSGIINSVAGNTSGALVIGAANTSGITTLTGASYLDSGLIVTNALGGTMLFSATTAFDVKAQQLTFTPRGTINVQGILASSLAAGGYVVMNGSGTLILSNTANSYTGTSSSSLNANGTQIAGGGILGIYGDGSLGNAPAGAYNNIQFAGSGTLQDTANNISLNANRNISVAASQTATFDSGGNSFTIPGIINGSGAVTKVGPGTLTLSGANTFSGGLTANAGTVSFATDGTSGGQPLGAYPGSVSAANVTLNGGGLLDTTTTTISANRGVTLNASGGALDASSGQTLTVSSSIAGTGALTKGTNSGTVSLNGVNTYSGNTTISGGTLAIGGSGQLNSGSYSGNITNNGILNYNSAASQTLAGIISGTGSVAQNGSGTLTLSGNSGFSGGANFNSGRINFNNNNAAGTGTITVGSGAVTFSQNSGSSVLPNAIVLNSGANPEYYATSGNSIDQTGVISGLGGLTRDDTGSGTVQLSGANTFSGGLNITSRGIRFNNPQAAGASTLTIGSSSAAPANPIVLVANTNLTGANALANTVALNQDFTLSAVNNLELSGPVTVSSGARTVTVNGSQILTLSGQVSGGAGGITITNSGTVRLGPAAANTHNTYTGPTTVAGGAQPGSLQLNNATAGYNAIGGDLTISGGSVSYNSSLDNQIPDTANVTFSSGSLAFGSRSETIGQTSPSAAGSFSMSGGTMTVAAGAVTFNRNPSITGGTVQLTANGSINFGADLTLANATLDMTYSGGSTARIRLQGGANTGITYPSSATATAYIKGSGGGADEKFAVGASSGSYTTTFNIADVVSVDPSPELEIDAIMISGSGYTGGINKTGAGRVLLTAANTFQGPITISAGTLSLGAGGSLNSVPTLSIAAGGTYDVSAISSYTLSSGTSLSASGTGTTVGASAAAIKGASGGTVSLGSRPITLTCDGSHPALYISQGTLSLSGNAFTVNSASPLAAGPHLIVQQATGTITSSGSYTVSGTAIGSGFAGFISVSGANVYLNIVGPPVANAATYSRAKNTSLKISITNLIAQSTSDAPTNDAVGLVSMAGGLLTNNTVIATTTNGSILFYANPYAGSTYLVLSATNNLTESFAYVVNDTTYPALLATNLITISVTNAVGQVTGNISAGGGSVTTTWAGIPGASYDVQLSTNLSTWTDIWTTNAPTAGVFIFIDPSPPSPAAYYRLRQN